MFNLSKYKKKAIKEINITQDLIKNPKSLL